MMAKVKASIVSRKGGAGSRGGGPYADARACGFAHRSTRS